VPRELLQQANAVLRLVQNATFIVGAAVGGIAVAPVGPGWAIAFDAVTFLSGDLHRRDVGASRAARGSNDVPRRAPGRLARVPRPYLALGSFCSSRS